VKNIVVCFDRAQQLSGKRAAATNAGALFSLAESSPRQVTWYDPGRPPTASTRDALHRRTAGLTAARASVDGAYRFLVDTWEPGDAVYVFGVGRGATCARELARLLDTVGVWPDRGDHLLDYVLDTYVLPRTPRCGDDWARIRRIAAALTDRRVVSVPVRYLGLWDAVTVPGAAAPVRDELPDVETGRHAVAIDGGRFGHPGRTAGVDEVWFRGAHCDVAGTAGACLPLADIALDWVLQGAVQAGLLLRGGCRLPSPNEYDALAGSSHPLSLRRPPEDANVHASVEVYLRAHPQYWRRLPGRIVWADAEWLARGERLVRIAPPAPAPVPAILPAPEPELATAVS
jgi:uncharacterized protein (DUF2235 family)